MSEEEQSENVQTAATFTAFPGDKPPSPADLSCQTCNKSPAYYGLDIQSGGVGFTYSVSATTESILCREHLSAKAWTNYLVTALLGWPGLHIIWWPRAMWLVSKRLRPLVGKPVSILLLILPFILAISVVGGATAYFMYRSD